MNFRKGEGYVSDSLDLACTRIILPFVFRYHYMDYVFVNAINYCKLTPMIMLLYDIVCKFIVNFRDRRLELPDFLTIPEGLRIKKGIGLFHVHDISSSALRGMHPRSSVGLECWQERLSRRCGAPSTIQQAVLEPCHGTIDKNTLTPTWETQIGKSLPGWVGVRIVLRFTSIDEYRFKPMRCSNVGQWQKRKRRNQKSIFAIFVRVLVQKKRSYGRSLRSRCKYRGMRILGLWISWM